MQIECSKKTARSVDLYHALAKFLDWLRVLHVPSHQLYLWGRGSDFDNVIIRNALEIASVGNLADYIGQFNHRCHRTFAECQDYNLKVVGAFASLVTAEMFGDYKQMKHIALNDAVMEAAQLLTYAYGFTGCDLADATTYYQMLASEYNFPLKEAALPCFTTM
jgi:hypothetical protein